MTIHEFCTNCDQELGDDDTTECPRCGEPIPEPEEPSWEALMWLKHAPRNRQYGNY